MSTSITSPRKRIATYAPTVTGGGGGTGSGAAAVGPEFGPGNSNDNSTSAIVRAAVAIQSPIALSGTINVRGALTMPTLVTDFSTGAPHKARAKLTGTALGAPFWQSIQTTDSTTNGTVCTITKPVSLVTGDLMIAAIAKDANSDVVTAPAGWTKILYSGRTGTLACSVTTFYKIATGSEAANYAFTLDTNPQAFFGSIQRINGTDPTTPVNVSAAGNGSAVSPIIPSVTTTAANCALLGFCAQDSALDITYTPPTGYTERSDQNGLTAAGVHVLDGETADKIQAASGASGTGTMTSTSLIATDYATQQVAIAPGTLTLL